MPINIVLHLELVKLELKIEVLKTHSIYKPVSKVL